jgi:S-formylglutathione hydrolase FrmB
MPKTLLRKFRFALLLLVLAPLSAYAQRDPPVNRITLESKLLGKTIDYSILYPVNYQRGGNAEKKFPVVYLLHGLTGHHTNWIERTRIALYATHYDLFIVMVEGENGWYTDSVTVPTDKFESYILEERRMLRNVFASVTNVVAEPLPVCRWAVTVH